MMTIKESINLGTDVRDDGGVQKIMMHAGIGERMLDLAIEVLDTAYVAANRTAVEMDVIQFVQSVFERAGDAGLPTRILCSAQPEQDGES